MPKVASGKYKRHYAWVFTHNNYKRRDYRRYRLYVTLGQCRYIMWGKEVGDNGTKHLQDFVYFKDAKSFTTVAKLFKGAHIEAARTIGDAIEYCKKDGNWEEAGIAPHQGARRDLDIVRSLAALEGMGVVSRTANMQQIRVAEKYLEYNEPKRDWKPKVIWLWGASGCGKTRTAHEEVKEATGDDFYVKSTATKWWSGYDAHDGVIIDDFRKTWWKYDEMLRLLDRYACQVEVKGGHRQMRARVMYITSILHPNQVYDYNEAEPWAQLERRIDEVRLVLPVAPLGPDVEVESESEEEEM